MAQSVGGSRTNKAPRTALRVLGGTDGCLYKHVKDTTQPPCSSCDTNTLSRFTLHEAETSTSTTLHIHVRLCAAALPSLCPSLILPACTHSLGCCCSWAGIVDFDEHPVVLAEKLWAWGKWIVSWEKADVVVLDEVSMVDPDLLEEVSNVMCA